MPTLYNGNAATLTTHHASTTTPHHRLVRSSRVDPGAQGARATRLPCLARAPWASYWREAIDKELAGLIALRTWDLIPVTSVPRGSNLMNCHYVFDVKRLRDGTVGAVSF